MGVVSQAGQGGGYGTYKSGLWYMFVLIPPRMPIYVKKGVQSGCAKKQKTPQTLSLRGFKSSP